MQGFSLHKDYFGLIHDDGDGNRVFGFENISQERKSAIKIDSPGGVFGYVAQGFISIHEQGTEIFIQEGFWFSTTDKLNVVHHSGNYRIAVWQRNDYVGTLSMGKWEQEGRLKYIDGCRDSILYSPIKKGMPCLNTLYMPSGVNQTMHTHPSLRSGFLIVGGAKCVTPEGEVFLETSQIFVLDKDQKHKFRSDHAENILMKLIAFHPDSDFGPDDENHPMLNKTMVDGVSANQIESIRTK